MGISKTQLMYAMSQIKGYTDFSFENFTPDLFTATGWGGVRFYNGKMQQKIDGVWVDAIADATNQYIVNMMPAPMKSFMLVYDSIKLSYKLKFEEPADTIVNNQTLCMVEGVKIMRKLGSTPANENDGILAFDIKRRNFRQHINTWLFDENNKAKNGEVWYYKAFPYSTTGFYNASALNEGYATCKDYELYAFKINQAESNPAYMISYPDGCDNALYNSAKMDFASGVFDYGDWKDAFFMQVRPCMLKMDGTVDYYLDPNDYSRKVDGTPSDVANTSYNGNCMIQFPKVYYKGVVESDNVATYYFSNKKIDEDYKCYAHLDCNGNEIPYMYIAAYNSALVSNNLKSISGQTSAVELALSSKFAKAKSSDNQWTGIGINDWQLLIMLMYLISKNTNTQAMFGNGNHSTGRTTYTAADIVSNGVYDSRGMFYGTIGTSNPVKTFGIENLWGNNWNAMEGFITVSGKYNVMMFNNIAAGGYNTDGVGYTDTGIAIPSTIGYAKKVAFNTHNMLPSTIGGSATTYYCDATGHNTGTIMAFGRCVVNTNLFPSYAGMMSTCNYALTSTSAFINVRLACKPLAEVN